MGLRDRKGQKTSMMVKGLWEEEQGKWGQNGNEVEMGAAMEKVGYEEGAGETKPSRKGNWITVGKTSLSGSLSFLFQS